MQAEQLQPASPAARPLPGATQENLVYRVGGKDPLVHVSWKVPKGIYFMVWTIWA